MTDIKKYAQWYAKMDYEGGLSEMLAHSGAGNTGDAELDAILVQVEEAMSAAYYRMNRIEDTFGEAIYESND